jgi:hypothetical protein
MSPPPELITKALYFAREVIDGENSLKAFKNWFDENKDQFPDDFLPDPLYKESFLRGSVDGFLDLLPLLDKKVVDTINRKFWDNKIDYKFNFLSKQLAEDAAYIHGFRTGMLAANLYCSRNKIQ